MILVFPGGEGRAVEFQAAEILCPKSGRCDKHCVFGEIYVIMAGFMILWLTDWGTCVSGDARRKRDKTF